MRIRSRNLGDLFRVAIASLNAAHGAPKGRSIYGFYSLWGADFDGAAATRNWRPAASAEGAAEAFGEAKSFLLRDCAHDRLVVDLDSVALGEGLDFHNLLGTRSVFHGRHSG